VVYDKSRKTAEEKASERFLCRPPLATTSVVTIDMEFDEESNSFVTHVKELHGMSTYGKSEWEALDNTAEVIRGYIKSMKANHKKIPLSARRLIELERLAGLR
jgi:predicted RNase H-like HicB family nuclease